MEGGLDHGMGGLGRRWAGVVRIVCVKSMSVFVFVCVYCHDVMLVCLFFLFFLPSISSCLSPFFSPLFLSLPFRRILCSQHVDPEEAVKIHIDVQAKHSLAIHWGTFALSYEVQ